ncbi:MAG TPA: aspartate/glutamate racemase family protein [Casimicrobiaceae bacterium]
MRERDSDAIRILWQSSTVVETFPAYVAAIEAHARERLFAGSTIEVRGVPAGTTNLRFKVFDFLNNRALLASVAAAEKQGFDAVAVGCFLDPVLDEMREILDIPVLSLGECAMRFACMFGKRFAIVSHTASLNTKFHADLIERYGLEKHAGPLISFELPFDDMVAALEGNAASSLRRITDAGRRAVAAGADVIILGCGLMNLVAIRNGLTEIDGAPVIDASGVLLKMTEAAAVLQRTSGLRMSRRGYYEKPDPADLAAALKLYGAEMPPRSAG